MAEVTTFAFDLREVTIALIKQQGIHEGRWVIGFEFGLGAGLLGQSEEAVRPSAVVQVQNVQLSKATPNLPALPFIVDAAAVNPLVKSK